MYFQIVRNNDQVKKKKKKKEIKQFTAKIKRKKKSMQSTVPYLYFSPLFFKEWKENFLPVLKIILCY